MTTMVSPVAAGHDLMQDSKWEQVVRTILPLAVGNLRVQSSRDDYGIK